MAAVVVVVMTTACLGSMPRDRRSSPLPLPRARDSFAGAAGFAEGSSLPDRTDAELAAELDGMVASGARLLRIDVDWWLVQETPTAWNWGPIDRIVDAARARGLAVLGMIGYTPPWARPPGTTDKHPPSKPAEYASFARSAVRRYAPRGVRHWEIWNEPNISGFWKPSPNAARYTALVKAAYPRIKAADPGATVLAGATSPAPNDGTQIDEVTFMQQVYAAGAAGSFDAWSHHPYTHPAPPGNVHPDCAWYQIYGSKPNMREVMAAQGDGAKKIWGTEYGPPTSGTPGSVSEATQAAWVTEAYRLWNSYDWAGPLFWYADRDQLPTGASGEAWNYYGLLREDFSPKPAWNAYRLAATAGA